MRKFTFMALTETLVSIVLLAIVLIMGFKILKSVLHTVLLVVVLALILYFFGYIGF